MISVYATLFGVTYPFGVIRPHLYFPPYRGERDFGVTYRVGVQGWCRGVAHMVYIGGYGGIPRVRSKESITCQETINCQKYPAP